MSVFVRLVEFDDPSDKQAAFSDHSNRYYFPQIDAMQIPGSPLAYWLAGSHVIDLFKEQKMADYGEAREGLATGNNEIYLRFWWEVSRDRLRVKWFPHNKGGSARRWYGNRDYVVNWENNGQELQTRLHPSGKRVWAHNFNLDYLFRPMVTWSAVSTKSFMTRYFESGWLFDTGGLAYFPTSPTSFSPILAFTNTKLCDALTTLLNPTHNFTSGDFARLPLPSRSQEAVHELTREAISIAKVDWDSREASESFLCSPLLTDYTAAPSKSAIDEILTETKWPRAVGSGRLIEAYHRYGKFCETQLARLKRAEDSIHEAFIDGYELSHEFSSDVDLETLTILEDEIPTESRWARHLELNAAELMIQFISYGVGCIFGRYSLDQDGLILANAGDDLKTYLSQIPEPTLRPDESGILPITDDNDFSDDLPSQWRAFLRAAFGDEHYEENLRCLEDGLGKRLRPYFLNGFSDDHVKRYKKRPIYWLITSPKGTLQALIYLHRYNRDTVNRFLNDYLRPYQRKLEAKRVSAEHVLTGGGSSQSEKTKAQKRIDEIRKALEELSTWERDVVRPLAEKRIELDLDDGVKVNYGKLGAILAKVKGLNA